MSGIENLSKVLICTSFVVIFTACGGGGGSSQTTSPNTPADPDTSMGNIQFNEDNGSFGALPLSLSATEGVLQSSQAVINRVIEFGKPTGSNSVECSNGGSVDIHLVDRDNNLVISSLDQIQITFIDCFDTIFNDIVDGMITLEVDRFSASREEIIFEGTLDYGSDVIITNSDREEISLTGEHHFLYSLILDSDSDLHYSENLIAEASENQYVAFTIDQIQERFTEFVLNKEVVRNHTTTTFTSFDIFIDSDIFQANFSCSTERFRHIRTAAYITCFGLNSSAIRTTGASVPIEIDPNGNGQFSATELGILSLSDIVEGFLFSGSSNSLSSYPETIETQRIFLSANDIVYDEPRNRVVMTSMDSAYPNALVQLDLSTNQVQELMSFSGVPNLVRFSSDFNSFYVTFKGSNAIHKYATDTLESIFQTSVDVSITDLEASPSNSSQFAVAVPGDIRIFENNSELNNGYLSVTEKTLPLNVNRLSYSSDGAKIFASRVTDHPGQSGSGLAVLNLNDDGVLTTEETYRIDIAGDTNRIGEFLFARGTFSDEDNLVRYGSYHSIGIDVISIDNNRIYTLSDSKLNVHRLDTQAFIGNYSIAINTPRQVIDTQDRIIVREDSSIRMIEKDLLTTNIDKPCEAEELLNLDEKPYKKLNCDIYHAIYDNQRAKIYATVGNNVGYNGNSVVVIDSTTLAAESYIPTLSRPRKMALSADKNYLYVTFDGSDHIARINLSSSEMNIDYLPISLKADFSVNLALQPNPDFLRRSALNVYSSPIDNDSIIVSVGEPYSCPFSSLVAFSNGVYLPNEIAKDDIEGIGFPDSYCGRGDGFAFDTNGLFYTYGFTGVIEPVATISSFYLDENGISFLSSFSTDTMAGNEGISLNMGIPLSASGGRILTTLGESIDIANQTTENLFPLPTEENGSSVYYVNTLLDNNLTNAYFLSSRGTLRFYNSTTGDELGDFNIPENIIGGFHPTSLVDLPTGVAVTSPRSESIYLIDNSDM